MIDEAAAVENNCCSLIHFIWIVRLIKSELALSQAAYMPLKRKTISG